MELAAGPSGIGLRAPHYREILEQRPAAGFLEVHSENFFCAGGAPLAWLERFRALYPMSFHGVGLSLGSVDPIDDDHLGKLEALVRRFQPDLVSEHLCWSHAGGRHSNDLLPLPYTEEALEHVCARVAMVQERLGRRILVENVSSYHAFAHSTIPEWEFVAAVARRSGCGLILDVNNIWVSSRNHGFEPLRYVEGIDAASVAEIHLAGYEESQGLLIDTHSRPVSEPVWSLYAQTLERLGPRPTLIEWDADIPALDVLLGEARKADAVGARKAVLETAA